MRDTEDRTPSDADVPRVIMQQRATMTHRSGNGALVAAHSSAVELRMVATIFVLAVLFFSLFTFRVLPPGDPAQNLYHMLSGDLQRRPTFILYTILGILFTSGFSALALPVDLGLNFMSALFGALGAACGYVIARALVRDRRIALTAVSIMMLSGVYWYQAAIGDLYLVSYSLSLLAMACFLRGRYVWAGGSYAASLLVYPVAALVAPFFLWVAYREHIEIRDFLRFVVTGARIYLAIVLMTFEEYFFGRMGIMPSLHGEPLVAQGRLAFDLLRTVTHQGYVYAQSFNVLLLVVVYSLIDTFVRHRAAWTVAMSAALGPLLFAFGNHGTDLTDPYFYASLLFLSILASLSLWGLVARLVTSRTVQVAVVVVCLVFYGSLSYVLVVGPRSRDVVAMKEVFLQLERELPAEAVLLSTWGISLAYNLYTRPFIRDQSYPGVMWTGRCHNIQRTPARHIEKWLSEKSPFYLLDGFFWRSPLKEAVRTLVSPRTFERLSGAGSQTKVVRALDRRAGFVKMDAFTRGPLVVYRVVALEGER